VGLPLAVAFARENEVVAAAALELVDASRKAAARRH
jgi:predicted outer membrane lipoprotein